MKKLLVPVCALAVLACIVIGVLLFRNAEDKPNMELTLSATLEKIVDTSELSTYTAVYNGIAEVMNEDKPEKRDYYVSYQAKVNAGFDFREIEFSVDEEQSVVTLTLPPISITSLEVDIGSMDFIFENDKANTSTVSQEAYKACLADAEEESSQQEAILKLAAENAENVLQALLTPILEQMDPQYELVFQKEG